MPAKEIKNADGTSTWIIDPHEAEVVAMLGDDYDYSKVSSESLAELVEELGKDDLATEESPSLGDEGGSA